MNTPQPVTCLGVIPVRLESTRFPNKPLKDINGLTLVERVWRQASKSSALTKLVVATNNEEIAQECQTKGMRWVMTSSTHETGTDRVAEACAILEGSGERFELVANIQGDMPFVNPRVIDSVITSLANADRDFGMATIGTPITSQLEYERPATVKIALGENGQALYFSRAPIPHWRNFPGESAVSSDTPLAYKHMGLYIFRRDTLFKISHLPRQSRSSGRVSNSSGRWRMALTSKCTSLPANRSIRASRLTPPKTSSPPSPTLETIRSSGFMHANRPLSRLSTHK